MNIFDAYSNNLHKQQVTDTLNSSVNELTSTPIIADVVNWFLCQITVNKTTET